MRPLVRLLAVARKELLQLRRDRLTLAMMVALPIAQLLLFGYAINTDVRLAPTVVLDEDRSARSRDFVRRMEATGFYRVVGAARSRDELARALREGAARVGVVLPAGYSRAIVRGETGRVQLIVDGSDPQTVASAVNTAAGLAAEHGAQVALERVRRAGLAPSPPPLSLEVNTWYNPEQRTAVFVVPGLVGLILTMTMVMLTAMALARERERGTMEQLIVSPVRSLELMVGKIVPYIVIGYVQMTLVFTVGALVFRVPIVGSLGLVYAIAALFIAANLALGLAFSSVAKTQQQAMQMSFFFLLPNILLSGFMFPWEAMPAPARVMSQALPLTHFLRIIRAIVLRGAAWPDVRGEVRALAIIVAVLVALSTLRFQKKL
ncbi:MAG: ABC transporter permease [Polyangiales bacterium]